MKKSRQKKSKDIINFYELPDVQQFARHFNNPTYDPLTQPLKHPNLRMVICGASGSGKSNILLNILNLMENTFEKILIFTQDKEEQLYQYLENKLSPDELEIFEGIENVMGFNFDNLEPKQHLIIFDDMCIESEKKQQNICELFIRGRKMAQSYGCSLIYLTQSYFQTPPVIRKQMTSLILRKINGKRDASSILKECSIDATTQQLLHLYEACCDPDDITAFLFIDFNAPDSQRFRYKFNRIININDF
jgi:hypothetical protein